MRAALYARVSTEEQTEGYSIDAQKRAFHRLCEEKEWIPYWEYIEAGKSAHTDDIRKRPVFKQAMEDGLAGRYDGLVVHKIDRFSRKLRVTLEYFEKLGKAGIGFVSIENGMDYSTPTGKFMLVMQGGLAELYSDNLSEETKKGWNERRKQGLYCGALPFGAMKGEDGVPIPDMIERTISPDSKELTVRNHEGLSMAFLLASHGKSDREVAVALNSAGYRSTGTHGARPFSKDTVGGILTNRFYIGEIPDGNGRWLNAKHEPLIDLQLFEEVRNMRHKNRTSTHKHAPLSKRVYSLTGITYCWHCREEGREGRIHVSYVRDGKARLGCYNRIKGWNCPQKSGFLDFYEDQIKAYLDTFHIPEDYQQRILEMHQKLQNSYDIENEQKQLRSTLGRLKDLYKWGDIGKDEYQREKDRIEGQLARIAPFKQSGEVLARLADYLASLPKAWDHATGEQRNKLVRLLFREIWVRDTQVVASQPRLCCLQS